MAEAVGIAASSVGLIGFAAQVTKLMYGYYDEAKNAREDIKQLADEISSLAGLLEPLSTTAGASKILKTSDSDRISQLVHEFRKILEKLCAELDKTRLRSIKTKLIWPFKKEDTQMRIQRIERLKTTVTVKLQLCVTHAPCS